MNARGLGRGLVLVALLGPLAVRAVDPSADVGQAIYRRGVVASGAPLEASRAGAPPIRGTAAACVDCHLRSGLGGREGRTAIPPITGRYLFRPLPKDGNNDVPFVPAMRGDREPYTDATLARAIRDGIDSQGRQLSYLMPNFALGDADMAALIGYLKRLDAKRIPGVTDSTLHFATVITPDADPVKRGAMLAVMKQFFEDRNVRQMVPAPRMLSSGKTAYSREMFKVHRRWELHVWELTGPESTWQQQLEKRITAEPVFALVSGLGGRNWAPIHAFCESAAVPCLFPNVDVPVDDESSFYSLYFSKGVLLEAQLMADRLLAGSGGAAVKTVWQVFRSGDAGEAGAEALTAALRRRGIDVTNTALERGGAHEGVAAILRGARRTDAVVLWLRPADIAALELAPEAPAVVLMSGLLGGLERSPLPASWRSHTRVTYPFDLPERRRVRVDYALGWMSIRRIPVVAEQVQADTYLACGLLSETLAHMVDTFVRDYLVERVEESLEHRIVTGYYPRLGLANGQRFASKGGYLVRFADEQGTRVLPDDGWRVP